MNIKKILKKEAENVKPDKETTVKLARLASEIKAEIEKSLKKKKIRADVFLGGSYAKGTIIRKKGYDIDIYVRFDKKEKEIDKKLASLIRGEKIHGSRDYLRIKRQGVVFEIIPVVKISRAEEAENVTDLSFFHVNYIRKCIKKLRLEDEIRLTKAFCYSNEVYGAESYIKGFSGYALELLICHYKSFLRFIKEAAEKESIIIDSEKLYKNKNDILSSMNESKMQSPIILVDPTFRQRNALAALSRETYEKFREACRQFLKNPKSSFFEMKEFDVDSFKRGRGEFVKLAIETNKQAGDIAGSKLLKFFNMMKKHIDVGFKILKEKFIYDDNKRAEVYLILERRKEIILSGPPITNVENVVKFKNRHKKCYLKDQRVYAREKAKSWKDFFKEFKEKNKISIREMGIIKIN